MSIDRVILVNSSNRCFQEAMPLGLMAVATTLQRRHRLACQILDLPLEQAHCLEKQIAQFWGSIDLSNVLFVGFSSMCNTLPRSLSLARALRTTAPDLPIIFGGPEASTRAQALVNAYPFIDAVVVGEAESVLPDLVTSLQTGVLQNRPGLWFRTQSDRLLPVLSRTAKVEMAPQVGLDTVEPIDYGTYPQAPDNKSAAIEVGRGCPYDCTFCSTKDFFRRRFRMKEPGRIVSEMTTVVRDRHLEHFDFVHDMFTADRKLVIQVCEAIIQASLSITWSCSARTDHVDEELLKLMVRAGCTDIYFGLETGSPRIQKEIQKNLALDDSVSTLRMATMLGIRVTASFIIGFPRENEQDLIDTVNLILRLRSWRPRLKAVQVHMLSPLAGTQLTTAHFEEILYDGHITGIMSVNYLTEWEETEVRKRPDLFSSFYYFPNPTISRSTYKWLYWAQSWFEDYLRVFYYLHEEQSGALLLDWARQMGPYHVQGFYNRWTALRRCESLRGHPWLGRR